MNESRLSALLVIDKGAYVHNPQLVERLRSEFDLVVLRIARGSRITGRRELLATEFSILAKLLARRSYRRRRILIAGSGHYAALVVARLLGLFGSDVRVFLYNFYLHGLSRSFSVRVLLSFLLTKRVGIAGQSDTDIAYFASVSPRPGLFLVPYGQNPIEGVRAEDVKLGDYVFAGGYSNRDYDQLLRCAARLPQVRFVVACSRLNKIPDTVPENVTVHRDLEPVAFHRLLGGARLVVVPLADDVGASGQMVTLASMQLGKTTIVPDFSATAQYLEPAVSGLVYEQGSDESLRLAIQEVLTDEETLTRLGAMAKKRYFERFTLNDFTEPLVKSLLEFVRSDRNAPLVGP
jgi:glycosyltransferase involved in cell wall biosynthesis